MSKKIILTIVALLTKAGLSAQPNVSGVGATGTHAWSVYTQGGLSFATGGQLMDNIEAANGTGVSADGGVGVACHVLPWLRIGLNYGFSKYQREQRFSQLQGDGLAYRHFSNMYHAVDATAEFSVLEVLKISGLQRWQLHVGTGLGWMFASGPTYIIKMGASETVGTDTNTDNYTLNAWLKTDNEHHYTSSCYIPLLLHLEYDVLPQLSLGLRLQADRLLVRDETLPTMLEATALTVRVNL